MAAKPGVSRWRWLAGGMLIAGVAIWLIAGVSETGGSPVNRGLTLGPVRSRQLDAFHVAAHAKWYPLGTGLLLFGVGILYVESRILPAMDAYKPKGAAC